MKSPSKVFSDLQDEVDSMMIALKSFESALSEISNNVNSLRAHHQRLEQEMSGDVAAPAPVPAPPAVPVTPPAQPAPIPAPVPQPAPQATSSAPSPMGSPGHIPDEIWPVADAAAKAAGMSADVLLALEVWETGWYDGLPDSPSHAWSVEHNPGGMKMAPSQFGSHGVVTERDPAYPTYLRFVSWQEGIRGHALFIGLGERYAAIHSTSDLNAQIDAIGAAGYAEGSPSWIAGVKAALVQVRRLRSQREGVVPAVPVASPSTVAAKIAAVALSHVGSPIDYAPETEGGRLGCAQVGSVIAMEAGVLDHVVLSVSGLVSYFLGLGWINLGPSPATILPGDGVEIDSPPPHGPDDHEHWGWVAIDPKTGKLAIVNNHGSIPAVGIDDLSSYSRSIKRYLRHP